MINLNWDLIDKKHKEIMLSLSTPNLDNKERTLLQKKESQYSNLLLINKDLERLDKELLDTQTQLTTEQDQDLKSLFEEEINNIKNKINSLEQDVEDKLYPADEKDERSVFLEIRAGAGGLESALFVADLLKTYTNYALSKNWEVSLIDSNSTDIGGFKELTLFIKGKDAYKHLKFESGVHRVQRVPKTETAGRIHTSTVTVAVLPEAKDLDVQINPQDLRIDTYRAGGAGGQHVNKTESAIRITHIPTGTVVTCQDERSQTKNKERAMKMLQSRILHAEEERKALEIQVQRKQQVGTGERAEKIRTYNYPQNRISDHRTELTLKKLDIIMTGQLDEIIEPLIAWEKEERKKQNSEFSQYFI
ncbi:MAG: Peptide chain release factor 1 [candidate division TM6 bacterium GW2011_GWF2_28_16]|nr:MAG: Peptide chain release factor 1 [candidate division TM6 bacterium GW2011_GWF2_28_16]